MKERKKEKQQLFFVYLDYEKKKKFFLFSPRTVTDILVLRKNILNYHQLSIYIQVIIFRLRQGILISILFNYAN